MEKVDKVLESPMNFHHPHYLPVGSPPLFTIVCVCVCDTFVLHIPSKIYSIGRAIPRLNQSLWHHPLLIISDHYIFSLDAMDGAAKYADVPRYPFVQ